jgi:transposase
MCNFKLDDVFSDVFGKSATRVLDALLKHRNGDFELDGLISSQCQASPEKIAATPVE